MEFHGTTHIVLPKSLRDSCILQIKDSEVFCFVLFNFCFNLQFEETKWFIETHLSDDEITRITNKEKTEKSKVILGGERDIQREKLQTRKLERELVNQNL
jgi:hypothetical protein